MEAISENSIVILSGETGCGKTTQVPQVSMYNTCARS
jgi:HrpA-like RNA helicase